MPNRSPNSRQPTNPHLPDDGTRQLLQWGSCIVASGAAAVALLLTVLGGFTPTGATTNPGWMALIVALMALPFGNLLLLLGVAKWLRNRKLARRGSPQNRPNRPKS
jgi:uncharacterized membrane protein YidH (DUF202 family)